MTVHHARIIALCRRPGRYHCTRSQYTRVHAQQPLDQLRARAEQGDGDAQFNLGVEYIPQDYAEAVRCIASPPTKATPMRTSNLATCMQTARASRRTIPRRSAVSLGR